ncbi:Glycoprotein-N-acetylgalactosamine 3-beta-galactosyltransferase 1 [Phytophthora cinnamomi]|uniref:Glycoprotein-N-acetylgalactosamine 3-beta-galactosyltransferase 1 n=1 Tax=Phytophthora cinnamomi TaxID=4785 RepID=UPI00355970F4|nr:Glycoprotein-N-acetylgalactosamine 3-beta-galactosyltransferase 1 [Phytophthora cinnamomi]
MFTTVWKAYLCHVCGHWVCEPCSRVMEREREEQVIRYIRCCESCSPLLNKWTPNLDEIVAFTFCPWVVQSSVSPLGVNLADTLRSQPERRKAALSLLRHLGKEVDTIAGVLLEDISENEWAATVSSSSAPPDTVADQRSNSILIRGAQHFVQQCLDVRIPEIPLEKCLLAEEDGRRSYPLTYESSTQVPLVPNPPLETERVEWIKRYKLHEPELTVSEEVELICELVAKEMESDIGVATAVLGDRQWFIPPMRHDSGALLVNERKQSFSSHALLSGRKPLLVRNAQLDVRFRNYKVATAKNSLSFFFGVPVLAGDGVVVATLCALDSKPRRSVTTMQYSVMLALAKVLAAVWREALDAPGSDDVPRELQDAPWTLRLRSPRGSASD